MDENESAGRHRIGVRPLLAFTTGLVFLTVVLGVATRATGSGLACSANWPVCDGGLLNLFPETLPSAFEWVHRLVAGVAGSFILASAVLAWRRGADSLVRRAAALGAVLLPVQVLLGRETVVSFVPPVLAAHYWTAMAIYGSFVLATVAAWRDALGRGHALAGLGVALVSTPLVILLGPPVVTRYTPPIQSAQYVFVLLGFAGLLLATSLTWRALEGTERYLIGLATGTFPLVVFLGRQRIVTPELPLDVLHETVAIVLFLAIAAAIALELRSRRAGGRAVGNR